MSNQLKHFIHSIIPEQHRWKIELFKKWDTIIGPLKNKVIIEKIDDETLYLCAIHPVWAQELLLMTPMLKQQINSCLSAHTIKTIRISTQKQTQKPFPNRRPIIPEAIQAPISLTPQEKQLLAPVTSAELQSSMGNYFIRCKKTKARGR